MKIYIIFCTDLSQPYDDIHIVKVFDDKELAEEYKDARVKSETDSYGYSIGCYEVTKRA